ncbi:DUF3083 family protein [Thalassomonas sp. M1454]|uniref:DUF3083 family protein n=1 Tax=Thalassomonas sp. M1454 TaxID=2594477 RepID=UPI00163D542B|nr:DUF3083 family protein [Thalassomonas sp. M1454]
MLKTNSRINLIRKRSAAHKVYVPSNARENQYLLVEFKPSLALVELLTKGNSSDVYFADFYRHLSHLFFDLCERFDLANVSFIAKNKLVRVMFCEEQNVLETKQQLLFMYNPKIHTGLRTFFNPDLLADKIELLFLATGDDIRAQAPNFHLRVSNLMNALAKQLKLDVGSFKIRDHQHLTYDIFANNKGNKNTITHGFRPINTRYQQQALLMPESKNDMTFAVASLPINKLLLQSCEIDESADDPYNPLYTYVSDLFVKIAKNYNLNQLALVANGKVPIIRQDNENYVLPQGEIVNLGFKTEGSGGLYVSQWDSKNLVDTIKLVFIATANNANRRGYGRFVNHLTQVLKELCRELGYSKEKDTITLRFHQHLMYYLPNIDSDNEL